MNGAGTRLLLRDFLDLVTLLAFECCEPPSDSSILCESAFFGVRFRSALFELKMFLRLWVVPVLALALSECRLDSLDRCLKVSAFSSIGSYTLNRLFLASRARLRISLISCSAFGV